jgi:catechol 2,3-dioxygenase-like lactoylglutathione lyase family enzyme
MFSSKRSFNILTSSTQCSDANFFLLLFIQAAFVVLGTTDDQANIELTKFYTPSDEKDIQRPSANTLGVRHIAFAVEDIEAVVAKLKKKGVETFSEIQNYEESYKLCYVRGPEGIILELAEQMKYF